MAISRKRTAEDTSLSTDAHYQASKRARPATILDYYTQPKPPSTLHQPADETKSVMTGDRETGEGDLSTKSKRKAKLQADEDGQNNGLILTESTGDIFEAARNSVIIHACNCEGSWGAGIAAAFKRHYPGAFKVYAARCQQDKASLFGKALLIPPQKLDKTGHFVGCLFTSRSKGKKRDSPTAILNATGPAMEDLLKQMREWEARHIDEADRKIGKIRMCKINSGLFAVPWEDTKAVLEEIDNRGGYFNNIAVISREE